MNYQQYVKAIVAVAAMIGIAAAQAQESPSPEVDHSQMKHEAPTDTPAGGAMDHGAMHGGSAPPDARPPGMAEVRETQEQLSRRDPHAYSGGYDFGPFHLHLMDRHNFYSVLADRLEVVRTSDHTSMAYDVQAWYGRTYDRVVLKAEGHADDGRLEEARTELLWGHAVAAFWDTQLGVRADHGPGPDRNWLAFGVQGLAPYWFEIDAAAYVGDQGRTALRLAAEYELLITQRLVLQPRAEANFYGQRDAERAIGPGLSDLAAGLRLRYEIVREFAPYLGVEWAGKYGGTADFARAAGQDRRVTRWVAGLRFWF